MPALLTDALNPLQKHQIQSMDPLFPLEDTDFFAFFEIENSIRSAAAFLQEGDNIYECYAYTVPEFRRQGLFTELLDLAIETLPEDTEFLFYTKGTDADTMAAIHALEAEPVLEEYMMEIDLDKWTGSEFSACENPIRMTLTTIDGTKTRCYQNCYGTVNISVFSTYYYLYGLEIKEEHRGHGHGKRFLTSILLDLAANNPLPLRLQVSGDNLPAVSLYKKTGFQITETLFGYLY